MPQHIILPANEKEIATTISSYLESFTAALDLQFPSQWSDVSHQEYSQFRNAIRLKLKSFYRSIDRDSRLTRSQKQFARYFPETSIRLLELARQQPDALFAMENENDEEFRDLWENRPLSRFAFEQLYCTPRSSIRRAGEILKSIASPDEKILFLGDDDLISILVASRFSGEIHVADLDTRILAYIRAHVPSIHIHEADFTLGGVPQEFQEAFDVVVTAPPFYNSGLWSFLYKAIFCLKKDHDARIFFSLFPLPLELEKKPMLQLWDKLASFGIHCEALHKNFNIYDMNYMQTKEYTELLDLYKPPIDSPFLDVSYQVPYAYSDFFELRHRAFGENRRPFFKRFFQWWHSIPEEKELS